MDKQGTSAFSYLKLGNCSVLTHFVPPDSSLDAAAMACLVTGTLANPGIFQPFKQSNRHNSCSSFDQSQLALLAHSCLCCNDTDAVSVEFLGKGIWPDLVDNSNNMGADGIKCLVKSKWHNLTQSCVIMDSSEVEHLAKGHNYTLRWWNLQGNSLTSRVLLS